MQWLGLIGADYTRELAGYNSQVMLRKFLNFLDTNAYRREVEQYARIVEQINILEPQYSSMSDRQLALMTAEFRSRLVQGEDLDDLLPEAFALVREAARRTIGMRHFDVQLIGGVVLHRGAVAEMRTGEGKTLVATLPLYLNALEGKGVHLVTVNDYLARRDARWMGPIFDLLGLRVGVLQADSDVDELDERLAYLFDPRQA